MDETIFTYGAPPLKFGPGALDEIGFEMSQHDVRRVLVITDPVVNATGIPQRVQDRLAEHDISSEIFDGVHVEPTDDSIDKAAGYAREQGPWDGFVAVGGGSSIDTAKAVNLITTDGGELMDYLNAPIGRARSPRGSLKPLFAVPTTAGTGSESTGVCVLDLLGMHVKSGISHWRLRPTLAIVDPLLTMSLPPEVTAAAGMDIVCHALESYTARWYESYERKTAETARRLLRLEPGFGPLGREGDDLDRALVPRRGPRRHRSRRTLGHDTRGDFRRHGYR